MQAGVDPEALSVSLRRLARQPDPTVLDQSLRHLLQACNGLFGLRGSGVMLSDEHGELRYVVASDETSRLLEDAQIATGQGPCVDTFVRDVPIASADLCSDPRWPELTARLTDRSVGAVLGVPVRLSAVPVGSLDVFRDHRHDWDPSERHALTQYAEVAGAMLDAAVRAEQSGALADQLSYAIAHRAPIERGVGYLMARDRIAQPVAFNRLREAARSSRRRIGEVADDLLRTGHLPGEPP